MRRDAGEALVTRLRTHGAVKLARSEGRARRVAVRELCRDARRALSEDARKRREELTQTIAAERLALRGTCTDRLARARAATDRAIEEARKSAVELDRLRRAARSPAQQHAAERARFARATHLRESDDEVRRNLSDELAAVWDRVKGRIRGSARRTRTEAFLEWVEGHQGDAQRIIIEAAERSFVPEETEAQYRERQASERRSSRSSRRRAQEGDEVPF